MVGRWPLVPQAGSARLARRFVTQAMEDADDRVRRRAALVTSELVANGIRHAHGGLMLQVHRLNRGWLVSVADDSPAPPARAAAQPLAEGGRGLLIIQRVGDQLGWARTRTGKVVWVRLDEASDRDAG